MKMKLSKKIQRLQQNDSDANRLQIKIEKVGALISLAEVSEGAWEEGTLQNKMLSELQQRKENLTHLLKEQNQRIALTVGG